VRPSRPALRPLVAIASEEDDATWLITFSDLVLLLLSFVAVGMLAGRGNGPGGAFHPTARVERVASRPAIAPAPPVAAPAVATVAVPEPPVVTAHAPRRLRALARRLESRLAAESLVGLAPVIVRDGEIVVTVARMSDPLADVALQPLVEPIARVAASLPTLALGADTLDLTLARTTRIAHELTADDQTLDVHVLDRTVAIRLTRETLSPFSTRHSRAEPHPSARSRSAARSARGVVG
jgi:hypothetical protein